MGRWNTGFGKRKLDNLGIWRNYREERRLGEIWEILLRKGENGFWGLRIFRMWMWEEVICGGRRDGDWKLWYERIGLLLVDNGVSRGKICEGRIYELLEKMMNCLLAFYLHYLIVCKLKCIQYITYNKIKF